MPYLWLIYSVPFVITPALRGAGPWEWASTLAGYAVFLPAYFYGYWVKGRRLAWILALFCVMAIVYAKSGNNPLWALLFPLTAVMLLAMYVNALRLCWTGRWMWRGTEFGNARGQKSEVRSQT